MFSLKVEVKRNGILSFENKLKEMQFILGDKRYTKLLAKAMRL